MSAPKGMFPPADTQSSKSWGGAHRKFQYEATGEYRPPRKGEYFLSGAIVEAYQAHMDLLYPYYIARMVGVKTCPMCDGTGKVKDNANQTPNA